MNQVPIGTQLPNGVQSPTEDRASFETLSLFDFRTPLGEPMDEIDAEHLALNPIGWHMGYWLNLFYTGVFRGEDVMLMALRIEIEINKIPEAEIAAKLNHVWTQRRSFIEEEGQRILEEKSPTHEISKRFSRDVDRMLMDTSYQAGNIERAIETS